MGKEQKKRGELIVVAAAVEAMMTGAGRMSAWWLISTISTREMCVRTSIGRENHN